MATQYSIWGKTQRQSGVSNVFLTYFDYFFVDQYKIGGLRGTRGELNPQPCRQIEHCGYNDGDDDDDDNNSIDDVDDNDDGKYIWSKMYSFPCSRLALILKWFFCRSHSALELVKFKLYTLPDDTNLNYVFPTTGRWSFHFATFHADLFSKFSNSHKHENLYILYSNFEKCSCLILLSRMCSIYNTPIIIIWQRLQTCCTSGLRSVTSMFSRYQFATSIHTVIQSYRYTVILTVFEEKSNLFIS